MKAVAKESVALRRSHTTCQLPLKHKQKSADRAEIGAGFRQKPVTVFRRFFPEMNPPPKI